MAAPHRLGVILCLSATLADKQGWTPYGYGMDTPPIIRETTSYGRGWQLLRSRGHKNPTNASGPCDPPQLASSCTECSASTVADDYFPACVATPMCNAEFIPSAPAAPPPQATILFVLDANASHLRFYFGRTWRKAYSSQTTLLVRAVHSLRLVNTTLPIHVLVSGERVPAVEARLEELGVHVLTKADVPAVDPPSWGSKWARGSFAKLRALSLSEFDRIIVLDADTIVLRNIDHLALPAVAAPAIVAGYKCYPRRELRAAVMVLRPSPDDWERARTAMRDRATAIYDDLGEGSVWRHLYPSINELPIGYAALRSSDLPAAEWDKVHVVHDPNLLRGASRAGWRDAGMAARLKPIDAWQAAEVRDHLGQAQQAAAIETEKPKAKPKAAPKKRARGRRRSTA